MDEVASPVALQASLARLPRPMAIVPLTFDLHEGHLALVRRARIENTTVAVSIFNSIRFGPGGLFARYPSRPERDRALLRSLGVDLLFDAGEFPMVESDVVEVPDFGHGCEGSRDPLHWRHIAHAALKLFSIVRPCRAYFGDKDFEQLQLVRRLAQQFVPQLTIVACATVRETDGLAFSASNERLGPSDRSRANALYRALCSAQQLLAQGHRSSAALRHAILAELEFKGLTPDYAVVVDADTLVPVDCVDRPARALAAAYVGLVRLIDNVPLVPR